MIDQTHQNDMFCKIAGISERKNVLTASYEYYFAGLIGNVAFWDKSRGWWVKLREHRLCEERAKERQGHDRNTEFRLDTAADLS